MRVINILLVIFTILVAITSAVRLCKSCRAKTALASGQDVTAGYASCSHAYYYANGTPISNTTDAIGISLQAGEANTP